MNDYEMGYLQGLRDAYEAANRAATNYGMLSNIRTLLSNFIAKFKKG